MIPELCPSCNESIGQSVAWCATCLAWWEAVRGGYCTVDFPEAQRQFPSAIVTEGALRKARELGE